MKRAVEMAHARPGLSEMLHVEWHLGNRCNYACSYCPPYLRDGSVPWLERDAVFDFCNRLRAHSQSLGRSLSYKFSGGEPTLYPHFIDMLALLKGQGCLTSAISNATAGVKWWTKAREHLDSVQLTHHIESVDIDHFMAVARLLSAKIRTHVNVTMHVGRFDDCLANARRIEAECPGVSVTLKPLLVGFGSELYPYAPAQLETLQTAHFAKPKERPVSFTRGPLRIVYDDGSEEIKWASRLVVEDATRFAGWTCDAGLEYLVIKFTGDIYRANCKEGGLIGNIADPHVTLPSEAIVCRKKLCHCLADVNTSRKRPVLAGNHSEAKPDARTSARRLPVA